MFLSDPAVMGQHIGSLLDAVANTQRLERSVLRNDEVCTYSPVEGIYDRKIGGVLALPLLLFLPGYTAAEMSLHGCTAAEVEGRLVHPTLLVWERSLCLLRRLAIPAWIFFCFGLLWSALPSCAILKPAAATHPPTQQCHVTVFLCSHMSIQALCSGCSGVDAGGM